MIKRILAFFEQETETEATLSAEESAAVLLIEVMMADHDMDRRERELIAQILSKRMNVSIEEVEQCIDVALERHDESHDLFQFTKVISDEWNEDQRFELVVDMWRVAFADGELDKYEDHRIRRVSELLHLHHSHFIKAKSIAKQAKSSN